MYVSMHLHFELFCEFAKVTLNFLPTVVYSGLFMRLSVVEVRIVVRVGESSNTH